MKGEFMVQIFCFIQRNGFVSVFVSRLVKYNFFPYFLYTISFNFTSLSNPLVNYENFGSMKPYRGVFLFSHESNGTEEVSKAIRTFINYGIFLSLPCMRIYI